MGVGSYLTRWIDGDLLTWFVRVELLVGLLGGWSATLIFLSFGRDGSFRTLLLLIVGGVGVGVGIEIPLLVRILEGRMALKDLIARVLFFDYLGALAASLLFPLLLVPRLGLIRSSLLLGILNALVGLGVILLLGRSLRRFRRLVAEALACVVVLGVGFGYGEALTRLSEEHLFPHDIIHSESTRFQRIVVTRSRQGETRLYLSGHLQFSSLDEYRYHEALVHVPLAAAPKRPLSVLVLGGGDGLAVREVLRYPEAVVRDVTLVDLDPAMTALFTSHTELAAMNDGALTNPRVTVVNHDAFAWVDGTGPRFDVAIVDFPDPSSYAVGKLYTRTFYQRLRRRLADDGVMVVQSTSPLVARRSFWCIHDTMADIGLTTLPYHAFVPAFGTWGYVLASPSPLSPPTHLHVQAPRTLRFLTHAVLPGLFVFPPDMQRPDGEAERPINRLNDQALVRLYDEEWRAIGGE